MVNLSDILNSDPIHNFENIFNKFVEFNENHGILEGHEAGVGDAPPARFQASKNAPVFRLN